MSLFLEVLASVVFCYILPEKSELGHNRVTNFNMRIDTFICNVGNEKEKDQLTFFKRPLDIFNSALWHAQLNDMVFKEFRCSVKESVLHLVFSGPGLFWERFEGPGRSRRSGAE